MTALDPTLRPEIGADCALQVAALCWRKQHGRVQIILITSRETRRWVIPKGWVEPGLTAAASALREAWEEAGVLGDVGQTALGCYEYNKIIRPTTEQRCSVSVFPVEVRDLKRRFPERKQRQRQWHDPTEAAALVAEPDLQALLRRIGDAPGLLTGR